MTWQFNSDTERTTKPYRCVCEIDYNINQYSLYVQLQPSRPTITSSCSFISSWNRPAINRVCGKPIAELWSVTCRMGPHSVTCHPTQVNAPRQAYYTLPKKILDTFNTNPLKPDSSNNHTRTSSSEPAYVATNLEVVLLSRQLWLIDWWIDWHCTAMYSAIIKLQY